ncbi:hypothetical protein AB0L53_50110 [Nonomuraea sp. NPDC052129]|uniref:hypothetical protein n=1 Tax=Nonomuraea sp. NPDC052129 TaxID=3154651 RepID=UPI003443E7F2
MGAGLAAAPSALLIQVIVDLGADPVGVGVAELFEDAQCAAPRMAGLPVVTGGMVGVAEIPLRAPRTETAILMIL